MGWKFLRGEDMGNVDKEVLVCYDCGRMFNTVSGEILNVEITDKSQRDSEVCPACYKVRNEKKSWEEPGGTV